MKPRCSPFVCAGLLFPSLLGAGGARACLNDRDSDSLAHEAKKLPDVVRVVTGRFERNPPLFYQMRTDRVQKEIAQHPERLALYDDVAVAYDRLGKDSDAIVWIEKKHTRIAGTSWKTAPPEIREAWYRYYANVGTFRVHRWIKGGADRTKLSEVVRARDEIARAIQIKPDAHFNRERYQLAAMNWILKPQQKSVYGKPYIGSFSEYLSYHSDSLPKEAAARIEGISGLVVLGAAWESVDVSNALTRTLHDTDRLNLAYLSYLRGDELRKQGRKSLVPQAKAGLDETDVLDSANAELLNPGEVKTKYQVLRREADAWQKERTAYLLAGLHAGRHPDTDTHFWDNYHASTAPPALANPSDALNAQKKAQYRQERKRNALLFRWINWIAAGALLLLFGFPSALILLAVKIKRQQKRFQRPTSLPE